MESDYDDIIDLPRPVSRFHKPMSMERRAAQFAPFAALTGHGDAIAETGRVTDCRIELSEYEQERLSLRLTMLMDSASHPKVVVRYFRPDARKAGGRYVEAGGRFSKILPDSQIMLLDSGVRIPLSDIVALEGDIFGVD